MGGSGGWVKEFAASAGSEVVDPGLRRGDGASGLRQPDGEAGAADLACGVPAVVSPVGVNRDIVRPFETGLWASDAAGWLSALRALSSPDHGEALRARLSQAGRRLVEAEYSAPRSAARYAQAVHQAIAPRHHAAHPDAQPTQ